MPERKLFATIPYGRNSDDGRATKGCSCVSRRRIRTSWVRGKCPRATWKIPNCTQGVHRRSGDRHSDTLRRDWHACLDESLTCGPRVPFLLFAAVTGSLAAILLHTVVVVHVVLVNHRHRRIERDDGREVYQYLLCVVEERVEQDDRGQKGERSAPTVGCCLIPERTAGGDEPMSDQFHSFLYKSHFEHVRLS